MTCVLFLTPPTVCHFCIFTNPTAFLVVSVETSTSSSDGRDSQLVRGLGLEQPTATSLRMNAGPMLALECETALVSPWKVVGVLITRHLWLEEVSHYTACSFPSHPAAHSGSSYCLMAPLPTPVGTTWHSSPRVTPSTPIQPGGVEMSQWEVWAICTFFSDSVSFFFAHMSYMTCLYKVQAVCLFALVLVYECLFVRYLHMPAVCTGSVINTDWDAGCCFAVNPTRITVSTHCFRIF